MAERLEERGFEVGWQRLEQHPLPPAQRLRGAFGGRPDQVSRYAAAANGSRPDGPFLLAHSYLSEAFSAAPAQPRLVDFVDLEWRVTRDVARLAPSRARGLYLHGQSRLLRRHERRLVRSGPSLFVTESEREWAVEQGADPDTALLVPNELPASGRREAKEVWRRRRQAEQEPLLAYVGKVSHRPNHLPLLRFLSTEWPLVRREVPEVRLAIAGRVDPATAEALGAHPGVEVLGFVPDVSDLLSRAKAAILPFASTGGSSLRVLFYALAGVPLVGSPLAFRGFPPELGLVAADSGAWTGQLSELLTQPAEAATESAAGRRDAATEILADPRPWDRLAELAQQIDRA